MDNIDGNVANIISSFLVLHEVNILRKVNRTCHEALFKEYTKKYNAHAGNICCMYPGKIVTLMGGLHQMTLYPVLRWRDRFHNGTGYIDSVLNEDMQYSIMTGVDDYQRAFISFRTKSYTHDGREYYAVDTLFQRSTEIINTWTTGSRYHSRLFQEFGYFMVKGKIRHRYLETNISNIVNNQGYILQKNNESPLDFGLGIQDVVLKFSLYDGPLFDFDVFRG